FAIVNRRQPILCRQLDDAVLVCGLKQTVACDGKSGAARLDGLFEGPLILVGTADFHRVKLQPELLRSKLACRPLRLTARSVDPGGLWNPQDSGTREFGKAFFK